MCSGLQSLFFTRLTSARAFSISDNLPVVSSRMAYTRATSLSDFSFWPRTASSSSCIAFIFFSASSLCSRRRTVHRFSFESS